MAKKQTSFGQFDTGGAVARQREGQERAAKAKADNAAADAEAKKKAGGRLSTAEKNAIARKDQRDRTEAANRSDPGVTRRGG
jgi:hypothetical protein